MKTTIDHSRGMQAALDYGRRHWPILPEPLGSRLPIRPEDATSDLLQIWKFWNRSPEAPIALATGSKAGIWALIAHGLDGQKVIDDLTAQFGKLPHTPAICCSQVSMTWLFRHAADRRITTIDCIRGLPVGVQGEHGRVLLQPSRDKEGREYRWHVSPNHASVAVAPSWLTDWIDGLPPIATSTVSPCSIANVVAMAASKDHDAALMQSKPLLSASSSSDLRKAASVMHMDVAGQLKTVKCEADRNHTKPAPDKPVATPLLLRPRRRREPTFSQMMM